MIVGLLLPERAAGQTEYSFGSSSNRPLEPSQDHRHFRLRLPHNMNVIRHNDERAENVQFSLRLPVVQSVDDHASNPRIFQPDRPQSRLVQNAVLADKLPSGRFAIEHRSSGPWQTTGQPPRHEDGDLVRHPMRQVPSGVDHFRRQTARPSVLADMCAGRRFFLSK